MGRNGVCRTYKSKAVVDRYFESKAKLQEPELQGGKQVWRRHADCGLHRTIPQGKGPGDRLNPSFVWEEGSARIGHNVVWCTDCGCWVMTDQQLAFSQIKTANKPLELEKWRR